MIEIFSNGRSYIILHGSNSSSGEIFNIKFAVIWWFQETMAFNMLHYAFSPSISTFLLINFDSLLILLETVLSAMSLSFVSFVFAVNLCPDLVIFCSLLADKLWLLDDDILFIASVVISSFVDFWLLFSVLRFSWLLLIVSLSMGIISLWKLIGILLLLIIFDQIYNLYLVKRNNSRYASLIVKLNTVLMYLTNSL